MSSGIVCAKDYTVQEVVARDTIRRTTPFEVKGSGCWLRAAADYTYDLGQVVNKHYPPGMIRLVKRGYDPLDQDPNYINLKGAVFELRTAEGKYLQQATSDTNGVVTFTDLDTLNDYLLFEVAVPAGYQIAETPVEIKGADLINAPGHQLDLIVDNPKIPLADLQLAKVGYDKYQEQAERYPLAGAVFELLDANGTLIDRQTSDADGIVRFRSVDLRYNYRIREVSAPAQYKLSENEIEVIGADVASAKLRLIDLETVENEYTPTGSITLNKKGFVATPGPYPAELNLEGAQFKLTSSDGSITKEATSNAAGLTVFDGLDLTKDYTIIETAAPNGYLLTRTPYKVTSAQLLQAPDYTYGLGSIYNYRGDISLTKVDAAGKPMTGIRFKLSGNDEANRLVQRTQMTDANGRLTFSGLLHGSYTLRELNAPGVLQNLVIENVVVSTGYQVVELGQVVNDKASVELCK